MEITFDCHGLTVLDAKKQLERLIANAPNDVTHIRVIHGFTRGDAIKTMVQDQNALRSKRILRRQRTMNKGETILEIGPK